MSSNKNIKDVPEISKDYLDSFVPKFSDLNLATMTVTSSISILFNLEIVVRYLPLDNYIVGKKCDGIGEWGQIKKNKTNTIINNEIDIIKENKKRKDFVNQITMIIYPYGIDNKNKKLQKRKINTKLFNNGQIVMTGCKKMDEAHLIMKYLANTLNQNVFGLVEYNIIPKILSEYSVKAYNKYIKTNQDIFQKLLNYIKLCNNNFNTITSFEDLLNKSIKTYSSKLELEIMSLFKIYQILILYRESSALETILDTLLNSSTKLSIIDQNFVEQILTKVIDNCLTNFTTNKIKLVLPSFVDNSITYRLENTHTQMINCYFYSNFNIDRIAILKLVTNKYGVSAEYEPERYQAVMISYISRVSCDQTEHKICQCNSKKKCKCICKCRTVTICVFRKGTVIITGANNWDQINDAQTFIQKVITDECPRIYLKKYQNKTRPSNKKIMLITEDFFWIRRDHILRNPRNKFIINEFKLHHIKSPNDPPISPPNDSPNDP